MKICRFNFNWRVQSFKRHEIPHMPHGRCKVTQMAACVHSCCHLSETPSRKITLYKTHGWARSQSCSWPRWMAFRDNAFHTAHDGGQKAFFCGPAKGCHCTIGIKLKRSWSLPLWLIVADTDTWALFRRRLLPKTVRPEWQMKAHQPLCSLCKLSAQPMAKVSLVVIVSVRLVAEI